MCAFTILNEADAFHADQSEPDKVDIDILVAGLNGVGVVSGCAVTAQGSPDMTCAVASGVTRNADGTTAVVASGNVTITAADATNPRIDLVVVSSAGAKSATAGTAAAQPVMPAIPATSVVLAAVYVPATDTTIATNQITDKRVVLPTPPVGAAYRRSSANYTTTSTTFADVDATNLALTITTLARRVQIGLVGSIQSTVAGDGAALDVLIDAAYASAGATAGVMAVICTSATASRRVNASFIWMSDVLSAGSHTFKLQWRRSLGSGTLSMIGDSTDQVMQFWVEETLLTA
jgi:hypothetical protein